MERVKPFGILAAVVILGMAVDVTYRYSPSAAWLMVLVILLGMISVTDGAAQRFYLALDGLQRVAFGKGLGQ